MKGAATKKVSDLWRHFLFSSELKRASCLDYSVGMVSFFLFSGGRGVWVEDAGFVGLENQLAGPCSVVAWEEGWERREKEPQTPLPRFLALLLCGSVALV